MKRSPILLLSLLALTACSNPIPEKHRFVKRDAATGALYAHEPRTEYEILEELPMEGTGSATRIPETKKAYALRRYIDPANKRILHERGVIYRVEEDARWNLRGTPSDKTLLGTVAGVREPHYVSAPLGSEMSNELAKQKALTRTLTSSVQTLATAPNNNAGERLVQAAGRIEEGQKEVLTKVRAMSTDMNELRSRVETLERPEPREATPAPRPGKTSAATTTTTQAADNGLEIPKSGSLDFLKR